MTDKILQKQEYLSEVIHRCLHREPELSLKQLAEVIANEVESITDFLKEYKKQLKK